MDSERWTFLGIFHTPNQSPIHLYVLLLGVIVIIGYLVLGNNSLIIGIVIAMSNTRATMITMMNHISITDQNICMSISGGILAS